MKRELSIERRGDLFHVRLHKYMGPWEGHQIEKVLDLEEVPPPPDGEQYEQVLGPNQAYLWREMSFDPEMHALITADRLDRLAIFVRDREVTVLAGAEFLPEPPPQAHLQFEAKDDTPEGSYIAAIDKRHESVWQQGPKAVIGALLVRAIPLAIVVFAIVVAGRHYGDKYNVVGIDEMFARAQRPAAEQSSVSRLIDPDFSHLVRTEVRTVSYASQNRMLIGDGNYVAFEGASEVMPWLNRASMNRQPIVLQAASSDGTVRVQEVRCGGDVLGRGLVLRRIAKLPTGDTAPSRTNTEQNGSFWIVGSLPVARDADAALEQYRGKRLCLEGSLVREGDQLVLRARDGSGVWLDDANVLPKMRSFVAAFTGEPGPVMVDVQLQTVFPWSDRADPTRQRENTRIAGIASLRSASAQNYHVHGRH